MKKYNFNARTDTENPYMAHRLVKSMWENESPVFVNLEGQFEVYADSEPIIGDYAKECSVSDVWSEEVSVENGKTYSLSMEISANSKSPDRHKKSYKSFIETGKPFKKGTKDWFNITDAAEFKQWLEYSLEKNGCEVAKYDDKAEQSDKIIEVDGEYAKCCHITNGEGKKSTVLTHSATAIVKITDAEKFVNMLRKGLGNNQYAGFGMVRVG